MDEIIGWEKLLIFLVVNVGLNTTDIVPDGQSFVMLLAQRPLWASLTLFWMFCPFLVHVLMHCKVKWSEWWSGGEGKTSFCDVLIHFPLILPLGHSG